jgi:DNA-directed RNA polymerase specialized sigma24 family protein
MAWTKTADKCILAWWSSRSAREIAEVLGVTRNAVIARYHRLRGHKFASDLDPFRRSAANRRLAKARIAARQEAKQRLRRHIERLHRRGFNYRRIAELSGITPQKVYRTIHGAAAD